MEITPLGDSALILQVRENFDDAPDETLSAVLATEQRLQAAQLPGVIELAPAYTTVALFYDPTSAVEAGAPHDDLLGWYTKRIRDALKSVAGVDDPGRTQSSSADTIEIPVCYAEEFAPDLNDVARHTSI